MSVGFAFGAGFIFLGVVGIVLGMCRLSGRRSQEEDPRRWDEK